MNWSEPLRLDTLGKEGLAGSEYPIMMDRKDLAMRNQRTFSPEFKRQVVEELLSGESRPAQLCRRYNISSSLLYHWKRQYSRGKFNNEPTEEGALRDRIEKLERLVGRLTLETNS